jgi:hypothetical protein
VVLAFEHLTIKHQPELIATNGQRKFFILVSEQIDTLSGIVRRRAIASILVW